MRMIINSLRLVGYFIIVINILSCNNGNHRDNNKETRDSLPSINNILAIGKVVPADGFIKISSPINAVIDEVLVKEGDKVVKGQLLIKLKESTANLDVSQDKAHLESLKASTKANQQELEKEEIILEDLKSKYETSMALFDKNAETKENVDTDLSNYKQQIKKIASIKAQIRANILSEKEQRITIDKSIVDLKNYQVTADQDGIITDLNVDIGQYVSVSDELGKMIDNANVIIEAEVDELFADSVKIGQKVELTLVGKTEVINQGKIFYVSPTLDNKSILFESANEAEDRRIRKVKIESDSSFNLLINSKVECRIMIK